jgi:hypothetical protein
MKQVWRHFLLHHLHHVVRSIVKRIAPRHFISVARHHLYSQPMSAHIIHFVSYVGSSFCEFEEAQPMQASFHLRGCMLTKQSSKSNLMAVGGLNQVAMHQ